jgi:hypothetical protein
MKTIQDLIKNQAIFAFIITTLWLAYAEPRIEEMIHDNTKHKIGTKGLIVKELDKLGKKVAAEDVPQEIATGIVWRDSLQMFDQILKPMLLDQYNTVDVGLKVHKRTKNIYYLHTDGKIYYPSKDTNGFYYFMTQNGQTSYCK